ncbi:MAG: four helix bundle protein [Planctomycetaceae bacterium]|jgi:four helix bundle protein|nr:four helix bundle protein [Planctomycetaceae bacterium]
MRMVGLRDRTKQFALRIVRLSAALPKSNEAQVIGKQLLRSGTSVAANFREASRARSNAEFVSKLGIVEQELDESLLWMELLVESEIVALARMQELMTEADELIRIVVKAIQSTKRNAK